MGDEIENNQEPASERLIFLNVPIDIIKPNQLGPLAFRLLAEKNKDNIVLLSVWDLLRARRNAEYREYIKNAALVIPISKSIINGINFLLKKKAIRYMPFDFIICLLTALEGFGYSSYLLGGKKNVLLKIENNIRDTFPRLQIVGRFPGSYRRQDENAIIEAIRKSSPSLLMVGKGVRGSEFWIARNSEKLGSGLRLWCSDIYDVFAERKRHPTNRIFELGLEWVGYCFQNPVKFLRIFPFIHYNILLLIYRIFKKKKMEAGKLSIVQKTENLLV